MFIIANFGKKTTILESEQFKFSLRERKERISRTHFMFSVPKREILRTKHCSQRSKKRPERGESSASVIRTLFVEARQEEGGAYVANNLPSWLALLFLSLIIMMRSTQGLFFSSFSSSQHLFCLCVRFLPFLSKSCESPYLQNKSERVWQNLRQKYFQIKVGIKYLYDFLKALFQKIYWK